MKANLILAVSLLVVVVSLAGVIVYQQLEISSLAEDIVYQQLEISKLRARYAE